MSAATRSCSTVSIPAVTGSLSPKEVRNGLSNFSSTFQASRFAGSSGIRGYRYRTAYSSSKWAVRGLTRTVALDAGAYGIAVNTVVPGIVETPRMDRLCREKAQKRGWSHDAVYQEYVDETTLRSITTPEDVANAVVFAASDDSRNMTGQDIIVDGGWMI